MWFFAQRFSEAHNNLNLILAEKPWPHNIALVSIPHHDLGDNRPDLDECLKIHSIDFAIWPFPFSHHREHILRLEDRGVRNLIIDVNGTVPVLPAHVIIDIVKPYKEALHFWREQGIRRVIVIEPQEYPPQKQLKLFARIASEMGFECKVETSSYSLPRELLKREKERVGIALLDEHSTAEFTLYNPPAFLRLLRRHRILFGNDYFYYTSFVPDSDLRVERIFIPNPGNPLVKQDMITAVTETPINWTAGDFTQPPITVPALSWANGKLWRFL